MIVFMLANSNHHMYIVVIDQGTSSTRAVLYHLSGEVKAQVSRKISTVYPKPGWVEQDPEEIWNSSVACLKEVCAQIPLEHLHACAITNQRETTIAWNAHTHQSYGPAIVWQDRRTQNWCERFLSANELIYHKTGLKADPYFSASKIKWMLDNHPEIELSNLKFGTVDSFLIWRLTRGRHHRTDITNAARTMLLNINTHHWDEDLLNLFEIPASILPEVCDSDHEFGYIEKSILGREIPILSVLGDQQAALIGVGCSQTKDTKVTFGTGGFLMQNLGPKRLPVQMQLLTTIAYKIKNKLHYALEGSIYDAGSSIDWLRQSLGLIESYQDLSLRLSGLSSNEGVYFIPAFSGLGAPYWLTEPGAMFVGLSRASHQEHLIRAVVESIAYQTHDILSMIDPPPHLKVDGGMIENQWFLQFLADLTGKTLYLPDTHENTAKGGAIVAACRLGEGEIAELSNAWNRFTPISAQPGVSHEMAYLGWKKVMRRFIAYQQV